ncbi:type II toxin-antitoxin system Phd/YefM family antitoxin [Sphingomonas ursincola]|jgi:prevent-host-death family protein|uniref:type II toxin-antitoxin system Phd/YefM family antitoxin n=1 Tax=Sphingomonas ursincola TaxID=56361 RepID=UPI002355EBAD|nr:type II toxin-antitoxin system prevent-host-death family antitoxin [Sphingomonas ursincola]MBY0620238.1 type II toxin-antitoxin system prevent-host-death family antitoxin [Sphingomonas ursincola]
MRHVPVATFKDKVSEFIAAAEQGDEIVITRHGKAAAKLVPIIDQDEVEERGRKAWEALAQLREELRAEGKTATIEEMIAWKNEGRR